MWLREYVAWHLDPKLDEWFAYAHLGTAKPYVLRSSHLIVWP